MLQKIGLLVLAIIISVSAFYQPVSAISSSPLLNGQHHYYTVQMRNDDQAITYAKIVFQNGDSENNRKTVTFKLPDGVSVDNISAQQILSKKAAVRDCSQYETMQEWSKRTGEAIYPLTTQETKYDLGRECTIKSDSSIYDENYDYVTNASSDIYNTYYYNRNSSVAKFEYNDLTTNLQDRTYTVTLAHEILPKKQGAILVSYTSKNFVSSFLGRFTYDYQTLVSDEMIDTATASISFDEGLYSRTAKQERTSSQSSSSGALEGASADSSYESKSLDTLQYGVGTGGTVTKTQSKMLAGDVMSITGVYATNPIVLFGKEILISLLVVALIGVGIWKLVAYRKKHYKISPKESTTFSPSDASSTVTWDNAPKIFQQETESLAKLTIGRMIAVSAVSIGSTTLILFIVIMVGSFISSNSYSYSALFTTFVPAFTIALILFGLFISPMVYVLRYGVKQAFIWSLVQVCFGIIGLVITLGLALSANNNNSTDYDSPSYRNSSDILKGSID